MRLNIYTRNSVYGDLDLVRSLANFDIDSFAYTEELLTVLEDFQVKHPYPDEWISPVFYYFLDVLGCSITCMRDSGLFCIQLLQFFFSSCLRGVQVKHPYPVEWISPVFVIF